MEEMIRMFGVTSSLVRPSPRVAGVLEVTAAGVLGLTAAAGVLGLTTSYVSVL
jgi:hypothetical protein